MREDLSGPEDSGEEEEEEEEEDEAPSFKWQGIESIFEAYQEYVEGKCADGYSVVFNCLCYLERIILGG